jgi:hypothetical protein
MKMDVKSLHTRASALKAHIAALTTELESLAPVAVNGDARGPQARDRIAAIGTERASLMLELEVAEAALRSPEYKHQSLTQRLDDAFVRNKPKLQRNLVNALADHYLRLSVGQNYANSGGKNAPIDLADLPRQYAAEMSRETYTREELDGAKRADLMRGNFNGGGSGVIFDNSGKIEELEVRLAIYARHTQELLASVTLPPIPPELQAKIDSESHRLERQRVSEVGVAGGWSKPRG